jgi:hypothetical protein
MRGEKIAIAVAVLIAIIIVVTIISTMSKSDEPEADTVDVLDSTTTPAIVAPVVKKIAWAVDGFKKACNFSNDASGKRAWEYVDANGRLVGGSTKYRDMFGPIGLEKLKAACIGVPNNKCKAIEHYPYKYGMLWYRDCDKKQTDWHDSQANTYTVDRG